MRGLPWQGTHRHGAGHPRTGRAARDVCRCPADALARRRPACPRARLHEAHRGPTLRERHCRGCCVAEHAGAASRPLPGSLEPHAHAPGLWEPAMKGTRIAASIVIGLVVVVAFALAALYFLRPRLLPPKLGFGAVDPTTQTINLGEYLARAGDCVACHTETNGKPFAGGRAMVTPFGSLFVPNITPDDETGIGK